MFITLWSDARYALRMLRRHPAFALAAIIPIALGIGLTTGVFSLIDSALFSRSRCRSLASWCPSTRISEAGQSGG